MPKIFVSVGTHPQAFNRLLKELDRLAGKKGLRLQVFAQAGNSNYKPGKFPFKRLLNGEGYDKRMKWCDLVISHGGAGTIINALLNKKPLLVVPRLKRFGEHTNDHQLDLAKALESNGKAVAVFEMEQLGEKISEAMSFKPNVASNREGLVKRISSFLEGVQ